MSAFFYEVPEPTVYGQRRRFAPRQDIASLKTFTRTHRLMSALISSDLYDHVRPWQRPTRFVPGHIQPGADMGRSASFSVTLTGKGDDPYGGVGLAAQTSVALGPDKARELAVQNGAVFSGASASRIV